MRSSLNHCVNICTINTDRPTDIRSIYNETYAIQVVKTLKLHAMNYRGIPVELKVMPKLVKLI